MEGGADFGFQLIKVTASLALVLGLLIATAYGLKHLGQWMRKPGTNAWLEILAQHSIGPKHHLLVVKVREQMFFLGISPQGIHFLAPVEGTSESTPAPAGEAEKTAHET